MAGFYVFMAVLFTVYVVDLIFLVLVAMAARSAELAAQVKQRWKSSKAKQEAAAREAQAAAAAEAAAATAAAAVGDEVATGVAVVTRSSSSGGRSRSSRSSSSPASRGGQRGRQPSVVSSIGPHSVINLVNVVIEEEPAEGDVSASDAAAAAAAAAAGNDDPELFHGGRFPKVLVQLPMFNEEAFCDLIVTRCCAMEWPRDRLLIQVLDDSTKAHVRDKVDVAAAAAVEAGHPVQVLRRDNRQGYKAGAMVEGLNRVEGQGFEYVVIFDADFEPPKDFLSETVGPLVDDSSLAYVQARWSFTNANHSFLTWAQKVNLGFHFDVEQRARSYLGFFFNMNGTAGVWRIAAIHDAGGWESDTVVEDMDLSLRTYLRGWNARYVPHVSAPNELPDDLSTFKTQQFRWCSGPMQILLKSFRNIWTSRDISLARRLNCTWFFMRYILFAVITFAVLLVPVIALFVEPWVWGWQTIYFVVSVNSALIVYLYVTPFSISYLIFSIAIGYFKTWAMVSGLMGSKKSKSWKVTAKKGAGGAPPPAAAGAAAPGAAGGGAAADAPRVSVWRRLRNALTLKHKPYALEMALALYYSSMAFAAFWMANWLMGGYCTAMALVFFSLSFGDYFM